VKIVHLSATDIKFGADRATYRLHESLRSAGVDSLMMVGRKYSRDETVHCSVNSWFQNILDRRRPFLDQLPLRIYTNRSPNLFSIEWVPERVGSHPLISSSDIVTLHWICRGFLRPESIATFGKPIVWRLSDMWAFTGGCHYSGECVRYQQECGFCPHLGSRRNKDLSHWLWKRKEKSWKPVTITIVTPSRWLSSCARKSSLFRRYRTEVIPNGINVGIFKPIDKLYSRELLGLPKDKKLVLFGAINPLKDERKGYPYLIEALHRLAEKSIHKQLELAVLGTSKPKSNSKLNLPVRYLDYVEDVTRLVSCYSAADVFVAPSKEDNFPSTVLESLACGTPVLAFNIGGMPDLIEDKKNGYLAKPFDTADLSNGIEWIMGDKSRHEGLSQKARQKVEEEFTEDIQAKKYLRLYEETLSENVGHHTVR